MKKFVDTEDHFIEEVLSLIKEGRNDEVISIFEKHSFQDLDVSRAPFLHSSVEYGNKILTQYLLNRYYNANAQNLDKTTPLMVAIEKSHRVIVKMLLASKANIMMVNSNNKNALHMIFLEKNFIPDIGRLIYQELCKNCPSYRERASQLIIHGCKLYQVCCFNDFKVVEILINRGFSVTSTASVLKLTGAHLAATNGDPDTVKLLVKKGANINLLDDNGHRPSHWIYECDKKHNRRKIELLKFLLSAEKNSPTSCDPQGFFHVSPNLQYGNYKAIRVVLQSKIDFSARDEHNGNNILHYLALNNNPRVVEELKPHVHKFDFNLFDRHGTAPLHIAVMYGNIEMVQFLLENNANPNCATNPRGYTPLHVAYEKLKPRFENKFHEFVNVLLQFNADPQCVVIRNDEQMTIFDVSKRINRLNKMKPVIAHLAITEKLGIPIMKTISTKINSNSKLKKYFNKCQKLIREEISGNVTLFKLLTCNEKRITQYCGNKELMLRLKKLSYKENFRRFSLYYYDSLKNRLTKGIQQKKLHNELAVVICKIFEGSMNKRFINETNPIVDRILYYLDDESQQQLYQCKRYSYSERKRLLLHKEK